MANTSKHTASSRPSAPRDEISVLSAQPAGSSLSPRVEMLRKLVASGQYQVSARYLAYKIFRAARVRAE